MSPGDTAPAVFLDRDGTLIEDLEYPREPDLVRIVPGASEALERLAAAGFLLVVVSNQSGIGRGIVSPDEAARVHDRFVEEFARREIGFAGAFYCPHAPDADCECRKPSPKMLLDAASALGIDLSRSFIVGDKPSDVEAGRRAGCRTVLLGTGGDRPDDADHIAPTWADVSRFVLAGEPA
jgi:D-glycero-D-manno-heptose 1,7-bisphosphate phosphatase